MPIDPHRAQRKSLSELVLEQLLDSLRDGKLKAGARLPPEIELSAKLGVGRSSVREALRVLTFMGVVQRTPGRGAVVISNIENPIPTDDVVYALQSTAMQDLYEVRALLEGGAAALAARRATTGDLAGILRAGAAVEARIARRRAYFRENVAFHLAIARGSHNNILVESIRRLLNQIPGFRQRVTDPIPGLPARDLEEHRRIARAIEARDPAQARGLMEAHVHTAIQAARLTPLAKPDASDAIQPPTGVRGRGGGRR
jgi:GntR family transcriptional repressor for pyruvate dehydrogenase complex